jgi:hypothetical protein
LAAADDSRIVGICLSGGGIRSAAFSLGALQALHTQLGLLKGPQHARYLSAVSGGSYTAAAYSLAAGGVLDTPSIAISDADLQRRARNLFSQRTSDGRPVGPDGHPLWTADVADTTMPTWRRKLLQAWAGTVLPPKFQEKLLLELARAGWRSQAPPDPMMPGTPESEFIRNHARYMAEPSGLAKTGLSFLWRIVVNMAFIVVCVALLGVVLGILNRAFGVLQFDSASATFKVTDNVTLVVVSLWLVLMALGFGRGFQTRRTVFRRQLGAELSSRDIATHDWLFVGWCLFGLLALSQFLPQLIYLAAQRHGGGLDPGRLVASALAALASVSALGPILISMVRSRHITMPAALAKRSARIVDVGKSLLYWLVQLVVAISLPLALLLTYLGGWILGATVVWGVSTDYTFFGMQGISLALLLLLFVLRYGGLHNFTLFTLYRDKLSRCFDLIRQQREDGTQQRVRQRVTTPAMFTLRHLDIPELLICASANLSEGGTAPAGANARPIVFSPSTVCMPTVHGAAVDTRALYDAVAAKRAGRAPLAAVYDGTVMTCVAVTGAAVSPSMGRFTRWWLRALMGFLNLRLGVWIPNPANTAVREGITHSATVPRVLPSLRYFIRELRGRHYLNSDLIYVTDGGHYENLGLVELVRRGCTEIWCIDGSGDRVGSAIALAEALTLVTSELGLTVDIDLSAFDVAAETTEKDYPKINQVYVTGVIRSSLGPQTGRAYECVVRVVKIGVDAQTSSRIDELRHKYRRFPYDSTMNQLYNAERFDMYRDLGFDSTTRAIEHRRNEQRQDLEGSVVRDSYRQPDDDASAPIATGSPPQIGAHTERQRMPERHRRT